MKKHLVVYYSNKGSNKYLAEKISEDLSCAIEKIKPRIDLFFLFLFNINFGIKPLINKVEEYERVILVGPIWMGRFIPPLRSLVSKYSNQINKLIFVTCCGSDYAQKDEKYGHGLVFNKVENLLRDKLLFCQAFPIGLVLPEDKRKDPDSTMNTRLGDHNFNGEILERYQEFIQKVIEN